MSKKWPWALAKCESCLLKAQAGIQVFFEPRYVHIHLVFPFSGEVQVWDMGREDDTLIATSGMGSDSHREPVTKVK